MTKAQIIERLKKAGVTGYDKKNVAQLEALAAANGVSLLEGSSDEAPAPEAPAPEAPAPEAPAPEAPAPEAPAPEAPAPEAPAPEAPAPEAPAPEAPAPEAPAPEAPAPEVGSATTTDPVEDNRPPIMITPQMACARLAGDPTS